ncbi:MAG TPA: amidohydrolase [Anaerolineales bacterium]
MIPYADRLLLADRIYCGFEPVRHVEGLAIYRGKVVAIGSAEELTPLRGPQTQVDQLAGSTVLPGLTDAHLHTGSYARSLQAVDCLTPTLEACLDRIRRRAGDTPPGGWIVGHGWDQNLWGRWPSAADLEAVAPQHRIYLTARSMHAGLASHLALNSAGIQVGSHPDRAEQIQRSDDGEPTGILFEHAMALVANQVERPGPAELADMLEAAQQRLWRYGVTGVHDFDGATTFAAFQILHRAGRLGLRILKQIRAEYLESALALGLRPGYGDDWLRIGNVKIFTDGALGPRTAAMLSPYEKSSDTGILLMDREQVLEVAQRARQAGFAMTIHAIGDRANHEALEALSLLRQTNGDLDSPELPDRIEHLQLMQLDDIRRPADLGVIASMQPVHATSDRDMAELAWGHRVERGYAWRSIKDQGAILAFGSDAPVEEPNPFHGLHAAVTRRDFRRPDLAAWHPEQCLTLSEALAAYTTGPALAAGLATTCGQLAPGYGADLIVLARDPFELDLDLLAGLSPSATMTGGVWRFREA